MAQTADVIIVGGGILGTSLAYYLAQKGVQDVVVLEKGPLAAGSTGKSAAIVRMHYTNASTITLALRSRELFLEWADRVHVGPVYTPCGWLFFVPEDQQTNLAENLALQRSLGVTAETWDLSALRAAIPGINTEGIGCVVHEAKSGYADPVAACDGLAESVRESGGRVLMGTPVSRILSRGDRVVGVSTHGETYEAAHVVLAAGAWSGKLAAEIGVQLPLEITREQEIILRPSDPAAAPNMSVSDFAARIYVRPRADGSLLVGRGYPKAYEKVDVDNYREDYDEEFVEDSLHRFLGRYPKLQGSVLTEGVVGLYTVTPDWHPLLGPVDGRPGLYVATGGSGHSFKIGPALGEMLADLIVNGSCDWADASLFQLQRFGAGREFRSSYGGNRA